MLLTRSRLCPRPKPGSSLHLHVLGTPPAFVLSQDQTLREGQTATRFAGENSLTRILGKTGDPLEAEHRPSERVSRSRPPSMAERPGPVRWWDRPMRSHGGARRTPRAPERMTGSFNLGTVVRTPGKWAAERRRRTWTHTSIGGSDRRVRMLLSFQRPSHLSGRGFLLVGRPEQGSPVWGGRIEYSAERGLGSAVRQDPGSDRARIVAGPGREPRAGAPAPPGGKTPAPAGRR